MDAKVVGVAVSSSGVIADEDLRAFCINDLSDACADLL